MKKEVIICDRCDTPIEHPEKDLVTVRITRGDEVTIRELCPIHGGEVKQLVSRKRSPHPGETPELEGDLLKAVEEARAIANRGLEAYAEGASPHDLAQALRDVSSRAKR